MKILEIVVRYIPDETVTPTETLEMYIDPAHAGAIFFNGEDATCFLHNCKEEAPGPEPCFPGSVRRIPDIQMLSFGTESDGDIICVWDPRTGQIRCADM